VVGEREVERAAGRGYARLVSALRSLVVAMAVLLLVAAPGPVSAQSSAKDVSQKASETVEAIKSYSVEKKDEAVAYAKKVGADADARIKELKAQAARQTGEAKARSDALVKDLEAKRAQAGRKAREMSQATKASWDRTKDAFAEAYREVAAAYDRAAAEIKK
jgi:small-conductance mechanosensitive channel